MAHSPPCIFTWSLCGLRGLTEQLEAAGTTLGAATEKRVGCWRPAGGPWEQCWLLAASMAMALSAEPSRQL